MYTKFFKFLLSLGLFIGVGFWADVHEVEASENVGENTNMVSSLEVANSDNVDDNIEGYEKYLIEDGDTVIFDLELAIENNESAEMLTFGEIFNSLADEANETPQSEYGITTYGFIDSATKYGNWCGRGNSGGTALDSLDFACMQHDKCYSKYGFGSSYCDRMFVNLLKNIKANGYSPTLGVYARVYLNAAIIYFS